VGAIGAAVMFALTRLVDGNFSEVMILEPPN
jgi:hypothetical protein